MHISTEYTDVIIEVNIGNLEVASLHLNDESNPICIFIESDLINTSNYILRSTVIIERDF
jgi:hypothetical protein